MVAVPALLYASECWAPKKKDLIPMKLSDITFFSPWKALLGKTGYEMQILDRN